MQRNGWHNMEISKDIKDRLFELRDSLVRHQYEVRDIIDELSKMDGSSEYYYDLLGDLDSLKGDLEMAMEVDGYIDKDFRYVFKDIQKIENE